MVSASDSIDIFLYQCISTQKTRGGGEALRFELRRFGLGAVCATIAAVYMDADGAQSRLWPGPRRPPFYNARKTKAKKGVQSTTDHIRLME